MKLLIDPDRCEGHGRCWELAPGLVDADDRGHGLVLDGDAEVPVELEGVARDVAKACPERAVLILNDERGT